MTRSRLALRLSFVSLVAALAAIPVSRSAQTRTVEWPAYAGDVRATKYSPLDQISRQNVSRLQIAWRQSALPMEARGGRANVTVPGNYQHTPLMAGGLLYMSTSAGTIAALDPATGRVAWVGAVEGATGPTAGASRGLAYWTDGKDARVVGLSGRYLVGLDAKTGKAAAGFGDGGRIDLAAGFDRPNQGFRWGGPPLVVRDVIVIAGLPAPVQDYLNANVRAVKEAPAGDIRGFDVRTGRLLWTFHVVPQPGEFGHDTWLAGAADYTGNSGAWSWMSADEELGYVYVPGEDATGDFYGGARPGNNLFSNALVCLDARTGKRVWHFQAIHHPIWDYDLPTAPILVDVTVNGRVRKVAAQLSKQGFVYVLDRQTGEPIWPIEERPVPKGDTPGEWYSPTQPFPTKPPAFELQGLTTDDLVDFTPELRTQALEHIAKYRIGPLYTPISPNHQLIMMPGTVGGANWNGGAVDPETGILYIPTVRLPVIVDLGKPVNPASNLPYVRRLSGLETNLMLPNGLPIVKPPYGSIVAIDLNTGDILWRVANGEGPRDHPALKGLSNLPPLGTIGRPSPLVTRTLLFLGEGMGRGAVRIPVDGGGKTFRAYDKQTGAVLWEMELPGGTTGAPMTYAINGKQFIVVAVGWEGMPAELIALSLP